MVCNSNVLFDDVFAAQTAFHEVAWALVLGFEGFCILWRQERHSGRCVFVYVELSYSCGEEKWFSYWNHSSTIFPLCSICCRYSVLQPIFCLYILIRLDLLYKLLLMYRYIRICFNFISGF